MPDVHTTFKSSNCTVYWMTHSPIYWFVTWCLVHRNQFKTNVRRSNVYLKTAACIEARLWSFRVKQHGEKIPSVTGGVEIKYGKVLFPKLMHCTLEQNVRSDVSKKEFKHWGLQTHKARHHKANVPWLIRCPHIKYPIIYFRRPLCEIRSSSFLNTCAMVTLKHIE